MRPARGGRAGHQPWPFASIQVYALSVSSSKAPPRTKDQLEHEKQVAARAALRYVRSGLVLGLGSGSTAEHFLVLVAERIRRRELSIVAVPSSLRVMAKARELGIPVCEPRQGLRVDLTVDGADEIAPGLSLIKGAGGALLREKVLAEASRYFLVIADSSKCVQQLGRQPLPVEVVPFALPWVTDRIAELGGNPVLRTDERKPESPFLTDQQNYIIDCHFGLIDDPYSLAMLLKRIPGLVEHGLFLGYAQAALIADGEEVSVLRPGSPPISVSEFQLQLD